MSGRTQENNKATAFLSSLYLKKVHFTASRLRFREEQPNIFEDFKVRTSELTMAEKVNSKDIFYKELKITHREI